ncbi:unnamed protein product, partial [Meganyctiphanes norvegica]
MRGRTAFRPHIYICMVQMVAQWRSFLFSWILYFIVMRIQNYNGHYFSSVAKFKSANLFLAKNSVVAYGRNFQTNKIIFRAEFHLKRVKNNKKQIVRTLVAPLKRFLTSSDLRAKTQLRATSKILGFLKNKFAYAYTQEFPYRTNHILECEFYLLESMDCCLIVYQPYRYGIQILPIEKRGVLLHCLSTLNVWNMKFTYQKKCTAPSIFYHPYSHTGMEH